MNRRRILEPQEDLDQNLRNVQKVVKKLRQGNTGRICFLFNLCLFVPCYYMAFRRNWKQFLQGSSSSIVLKLFRNSALCVRVPGSWLHCPIAMKGGTKNLCPESVREAQKRGKPVAY